MELALGDDFEFVLATFHLVSNANLYVNDCTNSNFSSFKNSLRVLLGCEFFVRARLLNDKKSSHM